MDNKSEKYLYIIFSSTPYKVGSLIRKVMNTVYNHVSISFEDDFRTLYSFARHHKSAPLYGGFVTESSLRYKLNGRIANIKVCAIPLNENDEKIICDYLDKFINNPNDYLYNIFSAMFVPFHRPIKINNAYTCIEFAINLLSQINSDINPREYYSFIDLEEIYKDKVIYEGQFHIPNDQNNWEPDKFMEKRTFIANLRSTFKSLYKLSIRLTFKRHLFN